MLLDRSERCLARCGPAACLCALLALSILPGCRDEAEFREFPAEIQVKPERSSDLGPHGGRLAPLDNSALAAELTFDPQTRTPRLYLLDAHSHMEMPVSPDDLWIQWRGTEGGVSVSRRIGWQEEGRPTEPMSNFRLESAQIPEEVRTIEDFAGQVAVILDGVVLVGDISRGQDQAAEGVIAAAHQHAGAGRQGGISPRALLLIGVYSVLIVLASLAGGWLPSLIDLTHTRMQVMVSLVGGLMLGIAVFHLIPHALHDLGSIDAVVLWVMFGLLTMFFMIRTFHFHQHGQVDPLPVSIEAAGSIGGQDCTGNRAPDDAAGHNHTHSHIHNHTHCRVHNHGHEHAHGGACHPAEEGHGHSHRLSWVGVTFGLALHTMIDGMALAASVEAESAHGALWSLFGIGTFLAVLLHKPLDAVSITSLMLASGWSRTWRNAINMGFAMMCPVGAALFLLGMRQFSGSQQLIVGAGLAFAGGVFLCISLGDLLPEVEFHAHDRVKLSCALLFGVLLAYGIGFLEPEHAHPHHPEPGIKLRVHR